MESSEISDTYLYGESKRSVIRTFRPDASCSNVSSRGDFPFMISLIVDFGIPVMSDACRTDRFLSYIISLSNIFMRILSADIIQIYKLGYNRKSVYIYSVRQLMKREEVCIYEMSKMRNRIQ